MPGFTPRKHQGKPVQQFADGGFVQRVKRAVGLDTEFNERVAAYRAQAAAEKAAKAPAPAPAAPGAAPQEQKAVTDYSGMGATQRREKALGLADGGLIQGPGTGTSDDIDDEMRPGTFILPADTTQAMGMGAEDEPDSDDMEPDDDDAGKVPVRVSNGEFEITPEQVQAIGAAVLRTVKDMTHEPAGQPSARGFAPAAQAFADGGQVKDEERQRLANQTAMYVRGAQEAAGEVARKRLENEGRVPSAVGMPLPQEQGSPFMTAPSARAGLTQGQTPAPATPAASPSASVASAKPAAPVESQKSAPVSASPSGLYMQDQAQELKDQWGRGQYAQAIGTGARTAVQGLGMYGLEMGDKLTSPWVDAAKGFGRGVAGAADVQPNAPTPTVTASPSAPVTANPTDKRLDAGTQATPSTNQAPGATAAATNQVMPGVFNHGRGQYSDQASGMGMPSSFTGQPNAQNMAAADNLAARGFSPSAGTPTAPAAGASRGFAPVTAPVVRNSTNDWQARQDLKNAQTAASSITANGGRWDRNKGVSQERATYAAMLQNDLAMQGMQPGVDVAAMREQGANDRAQLQDAGATTRAAMQEAGQNQRAQGRLGVEQGDLELRRTAQGFQTRAAQRLESLQTAYQGAKTDTERATIAKQIREIQGTEKAEIWKGVELQGGTDANGVKSGSSLGAVNTATGEMRKYGGQPNDLQAKALAIRDDKTMTEAQKKQALVALGF